MERALASPTPPSYLRPRVPSALDVFDTPVRQLLAEFPTMPATVIAERVGWEGSPSWLRKRVALLRPEYAPKGPADRLSNAPGDQAQYDLWFPATPMGPMAPVPTARSIPLWTPSASGTPPRRGSRHG